VNDQVTGGVAALILALGQAFAMLGEEAPAKDSKREA
jgi:hypothetical protein